MPRSLFLWFVLLAACVPGSDGSTALLEAFQLELDEIHAATDTYAAGVGDAPDTEAVKALQATYRDETDHGLAELDHLPGEIAACDHMGPGASEATEAQDTLADMHHAVEGLYAAHPLHSDPSDCRALAGVLEVALGEDLAQMGRHHDAWGGMHCDDHEDHHDAMHGSSGPVASGDAEPLHVPVERGEVDPETIGGEVLVAVAVGENARDVLPLELRKRRLEVQHVGRHLGVREVRGEVGRLDPLAVTQQHRALDHVGELAHVSGPAVDLEASHRFVVDAWGIAPLGLGVPCEEASRERWDVVGSLAQRRQLDLEDLDPEEEVLAEPAGADLRPQGSVGRGDQPEVHGNRAVGPQWEHLAVLQHSEQLHLHLQRHLRHLVEEDGASASRAEHAIPATGGSRECPLLVPEQCGVDQVPRLGGQVHRDEVLV